MFEIHKSLINELLGREMFTTRALLTLRINVKNWNSPQMKKSSMHKNYRILYVLHVKI